MRQREGGQEPHGWEMRTQSTNSTGYNIIKYYFKNNKYIKKSNDGVTFLIFFIINYYKDVLQ